MTTTTLDQLWVCWGCEGFDQEWVPIASAATEAEAERLGAIAAQQGGWWVSVVFEPGAKPARPPKFSDFIPDPNPEPEDCVYESYVLLGDDQWLPLLTGEVGEKLQNVSNRALAEARRAWGNQLTQVRTVVQGVDPMTPFKGKRFCDGGSWRHPDFPDMDFPPPGV